MAECSIDGCDRDVTARGFCNAHYRRLLRHGDPLAGEAYRGDCLAFLETAKEYFGDECLIWPYTSDPRPRISISLDCDPIVRPRYVTRIICEHAYGSPPLDNMDAAHSCGNGHLGCISRRHLRWATRKENIEDSRLHGSMACGEKHSSSKLTDESVIFIRNNSSQMSKKALALKFGVSPSTIAHVILRKLWAHVADDLQHAGAPT